MREWQSHHLSRNLHCRSFFPKILMTWTCSYGFRLRVHSSASDWPSAAVAKCPHCKAETSPIISATYLKVLWKCRSLHHKQILIIKAVFLSSPSKEDSKKHTYVHVNLEAAEFTDSWRLILVLHANTCAAVMMKVSNKIYLVRHAGVQRAWYVKPGAVFIIDNVEETIVTLNIGIFNTLPASIDSDSPHRWRTRVAKYIINVSVAV